MIGQKPHLSTYKKAEIISSILSRHNSLNLNINYRNKDRKDTSTWKLTTKPIGQQRYQRRNKKIPWDKGLFSTFQHQWDGAKAVLKGKFIAIQAYLKKKKNPQVNNII